MNQLPDTYWSKSLLRALFCAIILFVIISLLVIGTVPASVQAQSIRSAVYLPFLTASAISHTPNDQELKIAQLMQSAPEQRRAKLRYNPVLAEVARKRAEDMAQRAYVAHVNPDGKGPNYLVRQAGYILPDFYPYTLDANNIESIAAGQPTVEQVWATWLNSAPHRAHILATDPFYAAQIDYGIGYAYNPDSTYVHYWVIITAQPGP